VRSLFAAFLDFFLPSLTLCLTLARWAVVPRLLVSGRWEGSHDVSHTMIICTYFCESWALLRAQSKKRSRSQPSVYVMSTKKFHLEVEGYIHRTAGDKPSLPTGEQSANTLQLHCIHQTVLQLTDSPTKEIGAPVTHASQSLTLFTTRVTVNYTVFHWAPLCVSAFLISNFKYFKMLHIAPRPLSMNVYGFNLHASWACKRRQKGGLQERRRA
jgi:hypothetical protein